MGIARAAPSHWARVGGGLLFVGDRHAERELRRVTSELKAGTRVRLAKIVRDWTVEAPSFRNAVGDSTDPLLWLAGHPASPPATSMLDFYEALSLRARMRSADHRLLKRVTGWYRLWQDVALRALDSGVTADLLSGLVRRLGRARRRRLPRPSLGPGSRFDQLAQLAHTIVPHAPPAPAHLERPSGGELGP